MDSIGCGWDALYALHIASCDGNADAADLLLRWGADETVVNKNGETPSQLIQDIARASEQRGPTLERLAKLLAYASQDRAWRRRGFLVMCRAHPDRPRLEVETPDTAAEAIGQHPQRPSRRARRGQEKIDVRVGGAHGAERGGGAGSGDVRGTGRRTRGEGGGGGFAGVAAWLMPVTDEDVFRSIVGFL